MVTIPWWVVRYGFPALALALVTTVVVLARPALHEGEKASRPAPAVSVAEKPRTKATTKSAQATAYSVRSGDTLASIAEKFGTNVDRLMELNPGVDPTALRVGTPIRVD